MRRKIATTVAGAALALAALAAGPAPPPSAPVHSPLLSLAAAAPAKSIGAGGGNVSGAGERFGELLSGWGVPILIAVAGVLLVGALTSRNFGSSVGIVTITLVGLIFLLAPSAIEGAAKGIAGVIF